MPVRGALTDGRGGGPGSGASSRPRSRPAAGRRPARRVGAAWPTARSAAPGLRRMSPVPPASTSSSARSLAQAVPRDGRSGQERVRRHRQPSGWSAPAPEVVGHPSHRLNDERACSGPPNPNELLTAPPGSRGSAARFGVRSRPSAASSGILEVDRRRHATGARIASIVDDRLDRAGSAEGVARASTCWRSPRPAAHGRRRCVLIAWSSAWSPSGVDVAWALR